MKVLTRPMHSIFADGKDLIKVSENRYDDCSNCFYDYNGCMSEKRFNLAGACKGTYLPTSGYRRRDIVNAKFIKLITID